MRSVNSADIITMMSFSSFDIAIGRSDHYDYVATNGRAHH